MAAKEYARPLHCGAEGCEATNILAFGYCPKHYYRFKRRGSTHDLAHVPKDCTVEGCDQNATRKGLCGKHYQRLCSSGSTADPVKRPRAVCTVEGCSAQAKGHGYCVVHLWRVKKHGDPMIGRVEARRACGEESSCVLCGVSIRKIHKTHRFCSVRCQQRHRSGLPHLNDCASCGKPFIQEDANLCCSDECHKAKRRAESRAHKARERQTDKGKKRHLAANRKYNQANRHKLTAYIKTRRERDPDFRMACWMRSSLHKLLSRINQRKRARSSRLLGYNSQEIKRHIERQFQRGMDWSNYGTWHIDHIIPVAEHIRRGETDPKVVNALPNLRPMWRKENIIKSDKVLSLL